MTRVASAPFTIQVQTGATQTSGLNFPSNGDSPSSAFVAFQFLNPQNDGLPIWGPSGVGATYMWKYMPRQQTGYYVTMWWSNNGSFTGAYYGGHPYPRYPAYTTHDWELAAETLDHITTLSGSAHQVVHNVWYTQALRVWRNGNGTKTMRFYIALPSTAPNDIIEVTTQAGYGETNPASPALTFGDSPWYPTFGHERLSGVLRGIKVFNRVLTEADTLAEAASDNLVTATGQANIWYKKINPQPTNLLCEAGTGRNPVWAESTRATLWVP